MNDFDLSSNQFQITAIATNTKRDKYTQNILSVEFTIESRYCPLLFEHILNYSSRDNQTYTQTHIKFKRVHRTHACNMHFTYTTHTHKHHRQTTHHGQRNNTYNNLQHTK